MKHNSGGPTPHEPRDAGTCVRTCSDAPAPRSPRRRCRLSRRLSLPLESGFSFFHKFEPRDYLPTCSGSLTPRSPRRRCRLSRRLSWPWAETRPCYVRRAGIRVSGFSFFIRFCFSIPLGTHGIPWGLHGIPMGVPGVPWGPHPWGPRGSPPWYGRDGKVEGIP